MRPAVLLAAAFLAAIVMPAHAAEEDARAWLGRMGEALGTRNYYGLFTHTTNGQSETMRIVHRVDGAETHERLVSLDGSGREIVRTANEVHVYLPDRKVVLVEPRTDRGSLIKAFPAPSAQLDALYDLSVSPGSRILGRDVQVLDIRPRDQFRYGYRLWLDAETAMPLRSVVADGTGRVVEAIHFTRLEMPERIAASATEASVDATGFQWVRTGRQPATSAAAATAAAWRPMKMPPGFRLVGSRIQRMPGVPMPVQHLIFSDGFASVSVFIEPGPAAGPAPPEATSVGSANAFSTSIQGHVVTAVGEVPPDTVRDIAVSVAPVTPGATDSLPVQSLAPSPPP
ncbi:MAG: MucB/RseB C-terminal domain-containing protein [Steroidobacteraceae bacterium]|nr:MucB/RseB C-terminal domain-containing protein [Steroidobacteraceae bacterium]